MSREQEIPDADAAEAQALFSQGEIDQAVIRRWLAERPAYQPSLQEQIWLLEDVIGWMADLWYDDEDVRSGTDEEAYWDFIDELQDELQELRELQDQS